MGEPTPIRSKEGRGADMRMGNSGMGKADQARGPQLETVMLVTSSGSSSTSMMIE